jgi:hypothetical protein
VESVSHLEAIRWTRVCVALRFVLVGAAAGLLCVARGRGVIDWLAAGSLLLASLVDLMSGASSALGDLGVLVEGVAEQTGEMLVLGAIALVFARRDDGIAVGSTMAALAGMLLVRYADSWAELVGLEVHTAPSGAVWAAFVAGGVALAPWGGLTWVVLLLAATAWVLVLRCTLAVRRGGADTPARLGVTTSRWP